jgi:hypothetical protein
MTEEAVALDGVRRLPPVVVSWYVGEGWRGLLFGGGNIDDETVRVRVCVVFIDCCCSSAW